MAELDTSGGGHKKRAWCKKGEKAFYQGGFDSNGGFGFPAYHLFYFYHHYEPANGDEIVPSQGC